MRRYYVLTSIIILCFSVSLVQGQKVGHFDVNYVLPQMPEFKAAQTELQTYMKQLQDEGKRKEDEFKKKYEALSAAANTMKPEARDAKLQELQKLEGEIADFKTSSQTNFQKKQNEKLAPLYKKIEEKILEVSKEQNFDFILRIESLLYVDGGTDISDEVLKKMGVTPKPKE